MDDLWRLAGQRPRPAERSSWKRWQTWVGYATAGWSLAYGALGLHWACNSAGFPFGRERDPDADAAESILAGIRAETAAPVVAGVGLVAAPVAVVMTRPRGRGPARRSLLAVASGMAGVLLVVVPDRRLLLSAAYAPIILLAPRLGWSLAGTATHPTGAILVFRDGVIPWPVVNQFLLVAGGLLWAATAIAYVDHDAAAAPWTAPEAAARWGRWAVAVAVIAPLPFIITRLAWATGIPLGISEEFFRAGRASGLWRVGAALVMVTTAGVVLTLGLAHRWGEEFPGWAVGMAGKPVPPALALVPTTLASIVVTSAGLGYVRAYLRTGIPEEGWAMIIPALLWPVWGAALGAAALAYHYRRRDGVPYRGERSDGGEAHSGSSNA